MAAGDLRVIGFFDHVRVARLGVDGPDSATPHDFLNVNSPDDLELAERHASTTDRDDQEQEAGKTTLAVRLAPRSAAAATA